MSALPTDRYYHDPITSAADALGIQVHWVQVRKGDEYAPAFAAMAREGDLAALVYANPSAYAHRKEIVSAATQNRLPTVYENRAYVTAGGLMSYGVDSLQLWLSAAGYIDKILKGAKASDLPVQQASWALASRPPSWLGQMN
jgi:putative tryptophan/tyrosine transport system substrate-binding protein